MKFNLKNVLAVLMAVLPTVVQAIDLLKRQPPK